MSLISASRESAQHRDLSTSHMQVTLTPGQNWIIRTLSRWCNINRIKLPNIKCFTYVFPCDFAKTNNEVEIYGTGGMILQNMKNLLNCLPGLERLELMDLQLDGDDGREKVEVCRRLESVLLQGNTSWTRSARSATSRSSLSRSSTSPSLSLTIMINHC